MPLFLTTAGTLVNLREYHFQIPPVLRIDSRTCPRPLWVVLQTIGHLGRPPTHIRTAQQVSLHWRTHAVDPTPWVRLPTRVKYRRTAHRLSHTDDVLRSR